MFEEKNPPDEVPNNPADSQCEAAVCTGAPAIFHFYCHAFELFINFFLQCFLNMCLVLLITAHTISCCFFYSLLWTLNGPFSTLRPVCSPAGSQFLQKRQNQREGCTKSCIQRKKRARDLIMLLNKSYYQSYGHEMLQTVDLRLS